ncbi:MAG: TIGR02466 family protein [Gammaproteobacteria bacterium]|jgi:uncharacterized protein (TIGR02466 family)|nr:TIGR02466 family protein [Gammaproteobacteria bacterium]
MSDEDKLCMFFPTVIQVSQVENAEELNKRLLQAIYEIKATTPNSKPRGWCCEVYTTMCTPFGLLEREEFKEIRDVIEQKTLHYANALKYNVKKHKPKINECWVNVYSMTHSQEVHRHPNSVFSGIYYVKAPKGSAPTLFHSEVSDIMLEPPITENNLLNTHVTPLDAIEGRMIIFRSWLRHSVLPSTVTEDRVTIAFNATM